MQRICVCQSFNPARWRHCTRHKFWSAAVGTTAPEAAFRVVSGVLTVVFQLLPIIGVIVVHHFVDHAPGRGGPG